MAGRTPTPVSTSPSRSETSGAKRIRLSLACNQCRKRKVRCDTEKPKCRNCWLRDEVCETTDPRYPDSGPSVRRWATKDGLLPGQNPAATHRNQAQIPKHSPIVPTGPAAAPSDRDRGGPPGANALPRRWSASASVSASAHQRDAISASPAGTAASAGGSAPPGAMSWVSRGYQTSVSAGGGGGEVNIGDSSPDLVVNADGNNLHRVKYMGGSSVQCLSAFVNIYLRRKGLQTVSSHFRSGMRHVEEFQLALSTLIPPLPGQQALGAYLDTFFTRVWPVYPVIDRQTVEANIQFFQRSEFSSPGGLQATLAPAHVPQLVILFSIIAIAADEAAGEPTELGYLYLSAAYNLLAHLVATPYLTSVQALVLLAVALRCRCKDGQAWHVLAQAIRIAHSVGLHRYIRPQSRSTTTSSENPSHSYRTDVEPLGRVWWSCYALEKLMELETGRPSAINDEDIDQILPSDSLATGDGPDFFSHWVGLARILSQISRHLYRQKPTSAWQLMFEIGRLDQQLLEWANSMPDSVKPDHDLFAGHALNQVPYQQHISSFLSLQYYQAQITLLRASLVFPTQSFIDEVKRLGPSLPSYVRLLQSENICTGAARATVRQVLELADHGIHSLILSGTQLFLAAVVLALHVVKNPSKRLVRSDLELLNSATEHLETQFSRGGQHPNFVRGFETLRTSVLAAANMEPRAGMDRSRPASNLAPELDILEGNRDPLSLFGEASLLVPGITPGSTSFGFSDDMPLEELWGAIGNYSLLEPTLDDPALQPP